MTFERLFIEKQLVEKRRKEQAILNEINRMETECTNLKRRRLELEKMDVKKDIEIY